MVQGSARNLQPEMTFMEQERIAKLEARVETIKEDVNGVKHDIKELNSRITTAGREIVDKMDAMQTRIEHKMNAQAEVSASQHKAVKDEIKQEVDKIDVRMTALERWKWYLVGTAAAIGYLIDHIQDIAKVLNN